MYSDALADANNQTKQLFNILQNNRAILSDIGRAVRSTKPASIDIEAVGFYNDFVVPNIGTNAITMTSFESRIEEINQLLLQAFEDGCIVQGCFEPYASTIWVDVS